MKDRMILLKNKISESRMTQDAVAISIGMAPSTFYRKLKSGGDAFTVGEVHKLADTLSLTCEEATDIFLS